MHPWWCGYGDFGGGDSGVVVAVGDDDCGDEGGFGVVVRGDGGCHGEAVTMVVVMWVARDGECIGDPIDRPVSHLVVFAGKIIPAVAWWWPAAAWVRRK
ncbi:hypothetical protein Tco_1270188 [Tanacetum coccineum]